MIDYTDRAGAHLRLSDAERQEAVARLDSFAAERRLSDAEAAERAAVARTAVTRGDLAPLFADLPSAVPEAAREPRPEPHAESWSRGRSRRWAVVLSALMPFIAVGLFFLTGTAWGYQYAWLWFLLIPVTGILVYGPGSDHEGRPRGDGR